MITVDADSFLAIVVAAAVAAAIVGFGGKRVLIPVVVLELLLGMVIGPDLLGCSGGNDHSVGRPHLEADLAQGDTAATSLKDWHPRSVRCRDLEPCRFTDRRGLADANRAHEGDVVFAPMELGGGLEYRRQPSMIPLEQEVARVDLSG